MLSFSLFMLLTFTHCIPPSTSGMLTHDSTSGVSNYGTVRKVRTLVVFVCGLAPKYILLLLTHFRETQ